MIISIFHIACIVPLLLFVGFKRADTPEWLYHVLFGLGILVVVYHGIKAMMRYYSKSLVFWVNIIHVLLVGPLLIWIGYFGKKTQRPAYEMLLITGFGALGYHLKNMIIRTQVITKVED